MSKGLQLLIAVAAVVMTLAGVAYLLDFKREADERADRAAAAEMVRQAEADMWVERQKAKRQAEQDACKADLAAYDRGNSAPFVARATANGDKLTGENMLAEVQKCRELLAD